MGLSLPVHHAGRLPLAERRDVRAGPWLPRARDERLRRPTGARIRAGGRRVHRHQAPARGRCGILRQGDAGRVQGLVDARAPRLDGGAAIRVEADVLSREALDFVDRLHTELNPERERLLAARSLRRAERLRFVQVPEDFTVSPAPADLQDRRTEITGPVERKMMINTLNSGAKVFMADFEDANSPTWDNVRDGQRNVYDAVRRTIELDIGEKQYRLNDEIATLVIPARAWQLLERHHEVDGEPVSGSLFDFGLTVFNNAGEQLERGTGPYFYLPKLESHEEARLWARAFAIAEDD